MTHRELCWDLAWAKGTQYVEVPLGSVWGGLFSRDALKGKLAMEGKFGAEAQEIIDRECPGTQHADVVTIRPSYTKFCMDIFEAKVSRTDFMGDVKSGKWKGYLNHCHRFYFACLSGIAKIADVPREAGLYVRGDKGWKCVKGAEPRDITVPYETLMSMLFMRRREVRMLLLNSLLCLMLAQGADVEKWRLTIDDGPNKYTLAIAQRLKELKCPATFFVTGSLYPYKEDLKWIIDNGFGIGNHSRSHRYETMRNGRYSEVRDDIAYVSVYMKTNFGVVLKEFRAPYGAYGNTVMCVMREFDLVPTLWTSGVGDCEWAEPDDPKYDPVKIFDIACTVGKFPAKGENIMLIHSTRWILKNVDLLVEAMCSHGKIVLGF